MRVHARCILYCTVCRGNRFRGPAQDDPVGGEVVRRLGWMRCCALCMRCGAVQADGCVLWDAATGWGYVVLCCGGGDVEVMDWIAELV